MSNVIELDKLEIGAYSYDYQLDDTYFQAIEKGFLLGGNVKVCAKLKLRADDFDLHLHVSGQVTITCDRCLEPMEFLVDYDEDMELEEDARTIDLDWLAYEMIVVNLPSVHCHPEGGCNSQMAALLQNHLCRTLEEPEIQ